MRPTRAQVLAAVNAAPEGVTTADLSRIFDGYGHSTLSAIASKLASYGVIDRKILPGQCRRMVWTPRGARA